MKKILSIILCVMLIMSIMPMGLFGITASAASENTVDFAGGSGTETNPFLIETKEHLNNVRNDLGAHYKMVADIVFDDSDFENGGDFYNNGHGFVPIGDSSGNAFSGTFDGNGFVIYNIYVSNTDTDYAGLFGVSNGTVKNLGMIYGDIRETGEGCYAGGIVGYNSGSIINCYNTGKVMSTSSGYYQASSSAGGIAGLNFGSIANCYNTGEVRADSKSCYRALVEVGGICGTNYYGISSCYNTGDVTGAATIIYADHISSDSTKKTHNKGGICGYSSGSFVTSCYYLDKISKGIGDGTDNTKKCTEERLKLQSTFMGFDFENIWEFNETLKVHKFPVLKNAPHFERENTTEFAGGFGTEQYPFLIATAKHLTNVRYHMDSHYKLMCDIDLDDLVWTAIGDNTNIFRGIFDGCGYVIKNLYSNDGDYNGLFGYINGTIKNLGILNCYVSSEYSDILYVGAIVGYNNGIVTNCYSTGYVTGEASSGQGDVGFAYTGGIVGYNSGTISNCYSDCDVTAYASAASNISSYPAKSTACAGGIAGENNEVITNCYNTGSIYATYSFLSGYYAYYYAYAGGIVGRNFYGGEISDCYNIGTISSSLKFCGIAGYNYTSISDCYYVDNVSSGAFGGSSGTTKCTRAKMEQQTTYSGFDFETVWEIDKNSRYLYPTLQDVYMVGKSYITKIEVTNKPDKLVYLEGDTFDSTGMVVTLYYDDGRTVCTNNYTVSGYSSTPGIKNISVTYGRKSASISVEVEEITHIEVTTEPNKHIYLEGDTFDTTGMIVTAYSDNTSSIVDNYTVSGYDSTPGTKTITVTYLGKIATFTVEVEAKSFTHMEVTTKPDKLIYLEGDAFAPTGMVVTAYYNNNTSSVVTDYTVSGYDSTPGTKTIIVEYNGDSKIFEITVEAKTLTSIAVTKVPDKTEFLEAKEELSVLGGQITLYYNNGTSQTIDMLSSMVSGFDNTVVGTQTLTVTYNEKTATYDIEIIKKTLVSIELIDNGLKKTYIEGQSLDVTGGQIRRHYNNDTYSDISLSQFYISGFNKTTVGPQQLTVTYNGYSVYYDVEVIEKTLQSITVSKMPKKTTYVDGENFDSTGMVVKANYDNGQSVAITDYTISGYDSAPGSKTITVSYNNYTTTFTVVVEEKRLAYIIVTTMPNKTEYLEGEPFDPTGMVVTAYYYNCEDEIITDYTISGYDSTPSLDLITITYKDVYTNFLVTVKEKELVLIEVTTLPNKTIYSESTTLDDTGMVLTLYYNNNTSITVTYGWISEYDFSSVGKSTVKVTYDGISCTYDVTVIEKTVTEIYIESLPYKLEYLEGDESLNTDGLELLVFYDNDTYEYITDNYTVSGYDCTPGTKTITVTYGGKTATFEVEVIKNYTPGDIDTDGNVNTGDLASLKLYLAGIYTPTDLGLRNADINADGVVGTGDLADMKLYLAGVKALN